MLRALIHRIAVWLEIAPPPTNSRVHFYWIGEPTEVFAAESLEQALKHFADQWVLDEKAYGVVNGWRPVAVRDAQTGEIVITSLHELAEHFEQYPQQILSQYC